MPSEDLLELKFRELLLVILTDPGNNELGDYLQDFSTPEYDPFQQVMEANCLFNLTLADFARLLNMSISSFKRHFHSIYRTNPGQWLLDQRLKNAYKLLVNSKKSISDLSFESGFADSTHFSHAFKKRFGISPLKYRRASSASEPVTK
jgi:AraC-like DNA-binding protein